MCTQLDKAGLALWRRDFAYNCFAGLHVLEKLLHLWLPVFGLISQSMACRPLWQGDQCTIHLRVCRRSLAASPFWLEPNDSPDYAWPFLRLCLKDRKRRLLQVVTGLPSRGEPEAGDRRI